MRKISLDVNELRVESFETETDDSAKRGTVRGNASLFSCPQTMCGEQCPSGPRPCQPTDAWTDGHVGCYCGGSGQYAC
jgi:hypothetical protein